MTSQPAPQSIDPLVAKVLDSSLHPAHSHSNFADSDLDEDELLDALDRDESDPALNAYRANRVQQLSAELSRAKTLRNDASHGTYTTISAEKELMEIVTATNHTVVHFFHQDFTRCLVMDRHLEILAPLHWEVRFLRIDVSNAPFLCTKLGIKVLPCVLGFVEGVSVERIVGFEGLGRGGDTFPTEDLEARLVDKEVLFRPKVSGIDGESRRTTEGQGANQDDDDDDWD
ncbi:MAG: hypothetical protein MMC33_001129 [Icmadophila ericetorum]|nr:hypothetical protein [Icmadophila ericetorum]